MHKLMIIFTVVAMAVTGCAGGNPTSPEVAKSVAANIRYSKDARTSLCYATISSTSYAAYHVVSITNVPCTAEVESLIGK